MTGRESYWQREDHTHSAIVAVALGAFLWVVIGFLCLAAWRHL